MMEGNINETVQLPEWDRVYFGNVCYPKGSYELNEIIKAYIPAREASLVRIFELKERIGFEGLDLLWKLLELNPAHRISAEQAL